MNKDSNEETAAMDEVELVRIVHDLFLAGSETTTTALRFGFACLINHPESQAKMYDELRDVLPANRLANMNDKSKLPYTEATILEILRRASILPFSLPHGVSVDTEYRGYTIPKDAWILPNLDSALLDDTVWENPLCFNPGRFLNKKKSVSKPDEFIPFSLGPRTCLGEGLARMELLLFLSALVQHFEFLPPEGESPPTIATKFGMVASIMPYRLRAIKRV